MVSEACFVGNDFGAVGTSSVFDWTSLGQDFRWIRCGTFIVVVLFGFLARLVSLDGPLARGFKLSAHPMVDMIFQTGFVGNDFRAKRASPFGWALLQTSLARGDRFHNVGWGFQSLLADLVIEMVGQTSFGGNDLGTVGARPLGFWAPGRWSLCRRFDLFALCCCIISFSFGWWFRVATALVNFRGNHQFAVSGAVDRLRRLYHHQGAAVLEEELQQYFDVC